MVAKFYPLREADYFWTGALVPMAEKGMSCTAHRLALLGDLHHPKAVFADLIQQLCAMDVQSLGQAAVSTTSAAGGHHISDSDERNWELLSLAEWGIDGSFQRATPRQGRFASCVIPKSGAGNSNPCRTGDGRWIGFRLRERRFASGVAFV